MSPPIGYFITFHTYGTWLHGREPGSVDDEHSRVGEPFAPASPNRERFEQGLLKHDAVVLDACRRSVVDRTIREVAEHRGWRIHALNVRTTHVHAVLSAPVSPERVMNDLKSWCTRRMVEAGVLNKGVKAWARHGSTRWLDTPASLRGAIDYVANGQGPALEQITPVSMRSEETPP